MLRYVPISNICFSVDEAAAKAKPPPHGLHQLDDEAFVQGGSMESLLYIIIFTDFRL
jgi:hypothetical protein